MKMQEWLRMIKKSITCINYKASNGISATKPLYQNAQFLLIS